MRKKLFKLFCLIAAGVAATVAAFGFTACGGGDGFELNFLEENIVDDKYDNYYEIFVYSFYDSDGDGYGDLNGVTQKLDYIRDLGYTGIWLMPICPSASYHGYDVTDYKAVNPRYGTLEDYKNLVNTAHEKGIKVIIDLVVNHTSSEHQWFKSALSGNVRYADYYTFSNTQKDGYHNKNGMWYESWFDAGMPDLNLSSTAVREEIKGIMEFWLEDMNTDGFRLDGVKYYCPNSSDTVAFCTWLSETAKAIKENVYIVGELWSGRSDISEGYKSGIDSFFYFDTPGHVRDSINTNSATEIWARMYQCQQTAGEYIPAPFLSNHDNGVGRFAGRVGKNEDKIKFGYGLLSMYSGCTFTYYGDEIGMTSVNANSDPDLRVGMLWDNAQTNLTKAPPGASKNQSYTFNGVKEQLDDSRSILNYYKLCNNTRNAFPAIMRGTAERIGVDDSSILAYKKTYNGSTVTVVINLAESDKNVDGIEGTLAQSICVSGKIGRSGTSLQMPKYSIAILT